MNQLRAAVTEARLALKFTSVSLLGFAVDALVLHLGLAMGLEAAWSRLISLSLAMQVTFVVNAAFVFKSHEPSAWPRQWLYYMLSNGVGNGCNYFVFLTLVSTHWPIIANSWFALAAGSLTAWLINFSSARLVVFRKIRDESGLSPRSPKL